MHISAIKLISYKSYHDTGWINFQTGFNIIAGRNSVGKTALLDALSLNYQNSPHRSELTSPRLGDITTKNTAISVTIEVTRKEVLEYFAKNNIGLPLAFLTLPDHQEQNRIDNLWSIDGPLTGQFLLTNEGLIGTEFPSLAENKFESSAPFVCTIYRVNPSSMKLESMVSHSTITKSEADFGVLTAMGFARSIFKFKAERSTTGISQNQGNKILSSDASNLAEVISNRIQEDPDEFGSDFMRLVSYVLPQIKNITTQTEPSFSKIMVWNYPANSRRSDLAIPLSDCGTGVAQVLAILYVVHYSDRPRTLLIDEPNSFLHAEAAYRLMQILRNNDRHQYILTTHSPTIIAASKQPNIILLSHELHNTEVETVEKSNSEAFQKCLRVMGGRLTDTFSSDFVLWVEGESEEKCFPLILTELLNQGDNTISVIRVAATSDLAKSKKKSIDAVLAVYRKMSRSNALMPPSIGFVLDRESLSTEDAMELKREKGIHLLERRLLENYLLDADAIFAVIDELRNDPEINYKSEDRQSSLSSQSIQEWIEDHRNTNSKRYLVKDDPNWINDIHGAHLLEDIFANFNGPALPFDKVRDTPRLTKWLIENKPYVLEDITNLLAGLTHLIGIN